MDNENNLPNGQEMQMDNPAQNSGMDPLQPGIIPDQNDANNNPMPDSNMSLDPKNGN